MVQRIDAIERAGSGLQGYHAGGVRRPGEGVGATKPAGKTGSRSDGTEHRSLPRWREPQLHQ